MIDHDRDELRVALRSQIDEARVLIYRAINAADRTEGRFLLSAADKLLVATVAEAKLTGLYPAPVVEGSEGLAMVVRGLVEK